MPKTILGPSDEYLWPSKGDRLLRAENDWHTAVTFVEHARDRNAHQWDGYMRAGALLVEHCQSRGDRLDRHELMWPILFCYRHGLEIAMKWVIGHYGRYAGVDLADHMDDHDLWKLWKDCKKVLLEVGSDGEGDDLLAVEQVVKDFHELDKGGFAFRYSTDTKGIPIPMRDGPFGLANVKDVMEAVHNFFTSADCQLDQNTCRARAGHRK